MEASPGKLRKVCPQCTTPVHVRRAFCECGYAFRAKRKAQSHTELQAVKHRRIDRLKKVNTRASETAKERLIRQESDRARARARIIARS